MKPVTIPLGFDLQRLHDEARALARVYGAMADELSGLPAVCTHRYTPKDDVDGRTVACGGCGHLVPRWLTEDV